VVDYPNSAKAKKFYLCAVADGEVDKSVYDWQEGTRKKNTKKEAKNKAKHERRAGHKATLDAHEAELTQKKGAKKSAAPSTGYTEGIHVQLRQVSDAAGPKPGAWREQANPAKPGKRQRADDNGGWGEEEEEQDGGPGTRSLLADMMKSWEASGGGDSALRGNLKKKR